ncbi:hypothetical protein Btru_017543 [Bulinus truncatus]|nr:hypothetical protein Btru_017543 [Bulinus truncatus]
MGTVGCTAELWVLWVVRPSYVYCGFVRPSYGYCGFVRPSYGYCGFVRPSYGYCGFVRLSYGYCGLYGRAMGTVGCMAELWVLWVVRPSYGYCGFVRPSYGYCGLYGRAMGTVGLYGRAMGTVGCTAELWVLWVVLPSYGYCGLYGRAMAMNDNESLYVNFNDLDTMHPPPVAPRIQTRINVVQPQAAAAKLHAHPGERLELNKHNQSPVEQHGQPQVQVVYVVIPQVTEPANVNSQVPAIMQAQYLESAGFNNKSQLASTEFNATVQPAVAGYNATDQPAVPGYNVTAHPAVPRYNGTAQPAVPGFNVTAQPAVPGYNVTAHPAVPGYNVTAQPAVLGYNVTAQPPVSFNQNSSSKNNGMSHACSTLSVQSAPGGYGAECDVPKKGKKKKALTRFTNFLRQLKKGKKAFDKIIDSPAARELGMPELVDDAKQTVIGGARSLIGI